MNKYEYALFVYIFQNICTNNNNEYIISIYYSYSFLGVRFVKSHLLVKKATESINVPKIKQRSQFSFIVTNVPKRQRST